MDSFIRRENLKRYRSLLLATSDEVVRSQLFKLIAEEERRQFLQRISDQQSMVDIAPEAAIDQSLQR
jgi:hypothetical protein